MKFYGICLISLLTTSCGGSSSDNTMEKGQEEARSEQVETVSDCLVENDTITMVNGDICKISTSVAEKYSITSDDIICTNSVLTYGGGTYTSANAGITFNGLTFNCAAS